MLENEEKVKWLQRYRQAMLQERRLKEAIVTARKRADSMKRMLQPQPSCPAGSASKSALQLLEARQHTLAEQLEESESIRTEIEHTISCLPDMLQQTILLERYIDGKAWWQIANHLQITDRWAKELHRRAVQNLEIVHSSSC